MTAEILDKIFKQLVNVVGPIIAQIVMKIIVREAKIQLTDEDRAKLDENRAKAKAAREDEARRAEGK